MRTLMILTAGMAFATGPLAAQPSYNTVALSGQAAPGVPAGGVYTGFGNPVLNSAGQTAFTGTFTGTGITTSNDSGIWAGSTGSLALVAREGSAAPGVAAGGVYTSFAGLVLNSAGQTAFTGILTGTGITASNDRGIWAGSPGSLALVARTGSAAPGVAAGGVYSSFPTIVVPYSAGQTAFLGDLTGTGITTSNDRGIWAGSTGSLALVARKGDAAPGVAAGGVYSGVSPPLLNSAGQTMFAGSLTGTGITTSNDLGIWAGSTGSLALVAREGDAAPGVAAGGVYSGFIPLAFNSAGQTAFFGVLTGTGITASNNFGLWAGSTGSLALVARRGDAAPGVAAGGVYSLFDTSPAYLVLNSAGQTAFRGTLTGTGITASNDRGIWAGSTGSLALVAREGDAAPGVAAGGVYSFLNPPVLNSAGQTAFTGDLTGTGITGDNNFGLWAGSPGSLVLIAREGDLFDVDPGIGVDNRIITSISFTTGSGGEDGRGMSFNDSGLLVFGLSFTDNTFGIFTASLTPIPEPSLLLAAGLGLLAVRIQRARPATR